MAALTEPQIQQMWNKFSDVWEVEMEPFLTALTHSLVNTLHLQDTHSVLEVGCGAGAGTRLCNFIKPKSAKLYAVDLSPAMVQKAIQKIKDDEVKVNVASAEKLPFEDSYFDRYYSSLCLHLVNNPDNMLHEALRVLKSGSIAAFSVWGRRENSSEMTLLEQTIAELRLPVPPAVRSPFHLGDLQALRQRFIDAGFTNVLAWYQQSPIPNLSGKDYVERRFRFPSINEVLSKMTEDQIIQLKDRVREKADIILASGKPIEFEMLIVVGRKP